MLMEWLEHRRIQIARRENATGVSGGCVFKRARRKEARPGELLQSALEIFVEKGFSATRVEDVAQRAGVSKGTLFLYFTSKDDLFKAVVRHNISGQIDLWSHEINEFEGTYAQRIRLFCKNWWRQIGQTQASGICKLIIAEVANFPEMAAFYSEEVILPTKVILRSILEQGVARGEFKEVDIDATILSIVSSLLFMSQAKYMGDLQKHITDQAQDSEQVLDSMINILLEGLKY